LLQVFVDALGLAEQEGNMEIGGLHESLHHLKGLFKFLGELIVLLIAPRIAKGDQLAVEHGHPTVKVIIKLLEIMGEVPEFFRIDNGVGHGTSSPRWSDA
jgi:hypothetical protein